MKRRDLIKTIGATGAGGIIASAGTTTAGAYSVSTPTEPTGEEIFVDPNGDDSNPGTIDQPKATLEGARDAIRNMSSLPSGGVAVTLREGTYKRSSTFTLESQDSGADGKPIEYRAYDGEDVRISAGVGLPSSDWQPISGTAKDRVPSSAESDVMEIDLSGRGLDLGQLNVRGGLEEADADFAPELFYEGSPQQLARWPNEGWVQTGTVVDDGGWYNVFGSDVPTWVYRDDRIESWQDISDVWVFGYLGEPYNDQRLPVRSIDETNDEITLDASNQYPVEKGKPYYYLNVLDELDQPGEYFLDRDNSMLYFYPPGDLSTAQTEISQFTGAMVEMTDVSYVTFQGITFQTSRGRGVVMHGGKHNRLYGCTFDGFADQAFEIDDGGSSTVASEDNGLLGCDVVNTGNGAGKVWGGDRASLTPANNFVVNCEIDNFTRINRTYRGIDIAGVGNRIAHNEISRSQGSAIIAGAAEGGQAGLNECVIEYNHLHDLVQKASDAGAMYFGRNPTSRGNTIRYNYIKDVENDISDKSQAGIYLDDRESGFTLHKNVIVNADRGMLLGGGRHITATNNLFLFCEEGIFLDDRGLSWDGDGTANGCYHNTDYHEHLSDFDLQSDPWASQYPALADYEASHPSSDLCDGPLKVPCAPRYNVFRRNVFFRCRTAHSITSLPDSTDSDSDSISCDDNVTIDFPAADVGNNLVTDEPLGFTSPSNSQVTYQFASDSRVKNNVSGWESIPFSDVSLDQNNDNRLRDQSYDITESAGQFVDVKVNVDQRVAVDQSSTAVVVATRYDGTEYRFGDNLSASEITFESSDTSVMTVDSDGTVTGQSTGTATLTATVQVSGLGSRTGSFDITVAESQSAYVTPGNLSTFSDPSYAVQTFAQVDGPPFRMEDVVSGRYDVTDAAYGAIISQEGARETFTAEAELTEMGPTSEMGSEATTGIYVQNDLDTPDGIGCAAVAVKLGGDVHFMWDSDGEAGQDDDGDDSPGFDSETVVSRTRSFPVWLRLVKDGTTFKAEYSDDRQNWTTIDTATVSSAEQIQDVGLAAGGHTGYSSDNAVEYGTWEMSGTTPNSLSLPTVDTTGAGDATFSKNGGVYSIDAAGADVWDTEDEYGAIYQDGAVDSSTQVTTTVESQEHTNDWAKAGIMIANDVTAAGSSAGDVSIEVTPGNGFHMQWDSDGDGYIDSSAMGGTVSFPAKLRLTRDGTTFTGEYSTDGGSTWTTLDSPDIPEANATQDAALFNCSHSSGTKSLAEYSQFAVDGDSSASNLVTNPGFENGSTGWYAWNGTFSTVSSPVNSGSAAGELTGRSASWNGIVQDVTSQLSNNGEGTYGGSVFVRLGSGSDDAKLTLKIQDNNGTRYEPLKQETVDDTSWTEVAGFTSVSWSGLSTAELYVETSSSTADLYLDDVSLTI